MNSSKTAIFFWVFLVLTGQVAFAAEKTSEEGPCPTGSGQVLDSRGVCVEPGIVLVPTGHDSSSILQTPSGSTEKERPRAEKKHLRGDIQQPVPVKKTVVVYFFWGKGCPHCENEKRFFDAIVKESPALEVRDYEVWYNKKNAALLAGMLKAYGIKTSGVPITFIDEQVVTGFSTQSQKRIEALLRVCGHTPCVDPLDILTRKTALSYSFRFHCPGISHDRAGHGHLSRGTAARQTRCSGHVTPGHDARHRRSGQFQPLRVLRTPFPSRASGPCPFPQPDAADRRGLCLFLGLYLLSLHGRLVEPVPGHGAGRDHHDDRGCCLRDHCGDQHQGFLHVQTRRVAHDPGKRQARAV